MNNYNKLLLSLGSNRSPELNIASACSRLEALFPDIFFSEAVYTSPVDCPCTEPFLNCLACATTVCTLEEVYAMLKDLEEEAGRTPEGKHQGIVPLDIDILQWNEQILKPADMKRDYVREALRSLLPET